MNPFRQIMAGMLIVMALLSLVLFWVTVFGHPCNPQTLARAQADPTDEAAQIVLDICAPSTEIEQRKDPTTGQTYERPIAALDIWSEGASDSPEE